MCIIYNPQGVYYGGTIAAPVIRDIFENILPYLGAIVPGYRHNYCYCGPSGNSHYIISTTGDILKDIDTIEMAPGEFACPGVNFT